MSVDGLFFVLCVEERAMAFGMIHKSQQHHGVYVNHHGTHSISVKKLCLHNYYVCYIYLYIIQLFIYLYEKFRTNTK